MPKITEAIQPQIFEVVRDKIGAILFDELKGQYALQPNVTVLKAEVFNSRIVPFDKSECPLVNVSLADINYTTDNAASQASECIYNIDCFTTGISEPNIRGDEMALRDLHRLMGVIRAILHDPIYIYLDMESPYVTHRSVVSLAFTDAQTVQDGTNSAMGRISLKVKLNENEPTIQGVPIHSNTTTVLLNETDKGLMYVYES